MWRDVGVDMQVLVQFLYFSLCEDGYRYDRYLSVHVCNRHANGFKLFAGSPS